MVRRRLLFASVVALVAMPCVVPDVARVSAAPTACTGWCGGGEYHSLSAVRLFDSTARPTGPTGPSLDVAVLDHGGVPADATGVLAVVLDVHVISPTATGWARVWGPAVGVAPSAPSVHFQKGAGASSTVVVRPATDGSVRVQLVSAAAGTAHVVVTISGWFSTSAYRSDDVSVARGGRWRLLPASARLLDTRNGTRPDTPIGSGRQRRVPIAGVSGVPNDATVSAVIVAVTVWSATVPSFVTVLPEVPTVRPRSLDVPTIPGVTRTNLVVIPLGADGSVQVFNYAGVVNVSLDLLGYVHLGEAESTRVGRVIPLATTYRALDTRRPEFGASPLGPAATEDWSFASFVNSVTLGGTWAGHQSGLIGSLVNAGLTRTSTTAPAVSSNLSVYPGVTAVPPVGPTLATREKVAASMPVVGRYGTANTLRVRNAAGRAHYALDISAVVLAD